MGKVDSKELELPETVFSRDIEDRVFQGIVLQCIENIDHIALVGSHFIDSIFGREKSDRLKGIYITQESKSHSVAVKVEVNIAYGIPIPEKAEEIQSKVARMITEQTGLHVSCVHVVFRNVTMPKAQSEKLAEVTCVEIKE